MKKKPIALNDMMPSTLEFKVNFCFKIQRFQTYVYQNHVYI